MAYTKYSLTPGSNTAAPPDGAPEGMLPSAVNDTMRDMMAQIRDCGDGIRGGTYTMTAPVITGGSITGSTVNNAVIGGTTRAAGSFTTVTTTNDASISGLTVGKGAGSVATNVVVGGNGSLGGGSQTGTNNTALGDRTLTANTSGSYNTAVGQGTVYLNTTGSNNSGLGSGALQSNTTGGSNTALGVTALYSNTTASNNTAVGYQAGYSNTQASNSFFGYQSGYSNTTGDEISAFGYQALYTNTTGQYNSAFGTIALRLNTTGSSNNAFGDGSLRSNTTGSNNTAMGLEALRNNTTASNNTAVGYQAGYTNSTGQYNTFVGQAAGYTTTGGLNTFVGVQSGYTVTTGTKNSILGGYNGNQGGLDIRTASNYIVLSDGDGNPRMYCNDSGAWVVESRGNQTSMNLVNYYASFTGSIGYISADRNTTNGTFKALSYYNNGAGAYKFIVYDSGSILALGSYSNTTGSGANLFIASDGNISRSTSSLKYKRDVEDAKFGLSDVMKLRAVNYKSKTEADGETVYGGLIAEEVDAAGLTEFVQYADDGTPDALAYGNMVALCVKAIQELKAEVDSLKQQLGK